MTGAGRDATQGYLVVACAEAAAPRIPVLARHRWTHLSPASLRGFCLGEGLVSGGNPASRFVFSDCESSVRCPTRSGIVSVWVGQWSHLGKPNEDEAPTRPARRRGFFCDQETATWRRTNLTSEHPTLPSFQPENQTLK